MPKRGAIALLLTAAALALLLSFKTPSTDPAATGDLALAPPSAASPATVPDTATPAPVTAATPPAAGVATPAPAATPAPTAPSQRSAALRDGTVTGTAVRIRWGTVQVQATIQDGVITDVAALQLPTGDRHSYDISTRAEPVLRSAALTAQSADITILSGATYTSLAYAESLQSALDAARS